MVHGIRPTIHRSQPIRITTAADNPRQELAHRQRRYVISMTIRAFCFVAAVLTRGTWWCWALIVLAFVLPYVAVVMANAASPRVPGTELRDPEQQHHELE